MNQQNINKGTAADNGTGTPARSAADIINNNFAKLFAVFVTLNNNVFGFRKKPGNVGAGFETGDCIYMGYWDANEFFEKAEFLGGDENVRANWQKIDLSVGAAGKSAYQIWLDQGNVGTEASFLNSLRGADGQDGQDGAPGPQGAAGQDGSPGGADGPQGVQGLSAYEIWVQDGNTGTPTDFLNSLKGSTGIVRLDDTSDKTGVWVIGSHPNILGGKKFIGLSNNTQPTTTAHIDEFLIVK